MSISMKTTAAIALALATATVSTSVSAATTVNVSTGVNTWTVNPGTVIVPGTINSAWVGSTGNTADANGAKWITPSNCSVSCDPTANQDYIYTTVFSLPNISGLTAVSLAGRFWVDNQVIEILLNGVHSLTVTPGGTFSGLGTIFGTSNLSQFVTGNNTLTFKVRNIGQRTGNPSGLRISALVTAVPEPSTWLLMLMGFGFVGFQMRRRQKTRVRFQFA